MALLQRLPVDEQALHEFCQRWKIVKLELFGSMLRPDFGPLSDIDLLVTFSADARWSLLDHVRMENEGSELLGRRTDLVSRRAIEASHNAVRRSAILGTAVPVYVAG
jgi:uncharacterized protein